MGKCRLVYALKIFVAKGCLVFDGNDGPRVLRAVERGSGGEA